MVYSIFSLTQLLTILLLLILTQQVPKIQVMKSVTTTEAATDLIANANLYLRLIGRPGNMFQSQFSNGLPGSQ